jgi:hypothetical protein
MTIDPMAGQTRSRFAHLRVRAWNVIVAAWAAVTGIAPHVLHHVGPLAGTALVAGAGGQLLFGAVGLIATIPMLRKLYRRFGTWVAPTIALALFGTMFSFSTFVLGPAISDTTTQTPQVDTNEHDDHEHGTGAGTDPTR